MPTPVSFSLTGQLCEFPDVTNLPSVDKSSNKVCQAIARLHPEMLKKELSISPALREGIDKLEGGNEKEILQFVLKSLEGENPVKSLAPTSVDSKMPSRMGAKFTIAGPHGAHLVRYACSESHPDKIVYLSVRKQTGQRIAIINVDTKDSIAVDGNKNNHESRRTNLKRQRSGSFMESQLREKVKRLKPESFSKLLLKSGVSLTFGSKEKFAIKVMNPHVEKDSEKIKKLVNRFMEDFEQKKENKILSDGLEKTEEIQLKRAGLAIKELLEWGFENDGILVCRTGEGKVGGFLAFTKSEENKNLKVQIFLKDIFSHSHDVPYALMICLANLSRSFGADWDIVLDAIPGTEKVYMERYGFEFEKKDKDARAYTKEEVIDFYNNGQLFPSGNLNKKMVLKLRENKHWIDDGDWLSLKETPSK